MNDIIHLREREPAQEEGAALLAQFEGLDTASLSDALDSLGLAGGLHGLAQRVAGSRCVGFAYTVRYESVAEAGGFRNAADYIDAVPANAVIVSSNAGRTDCTVWGDILTHVAISRNIRGSLIDGAARDLDTIQRLNYPLFSRAVYMQNGKNRVQSNRGCRKNQYPRNRGFPISPLPLPGDFS